MAASPDARQARIARLKRRMRGMNPEQRAAFRQRLEEFKGRSPEEKAELRRRMKELKGRDPAERKRLHRLSKRRSRGELDPQHERLRQVPNEQRKKYRKLVHRLIRGLPKAERRDLAQLGPAERRRKIRSLLSDHRQRHMDRKLDKLPEDVRKEAGRGMRGLRGRERFQQGRQAIDGYVRRQAQKIMKNRDLAPGERQRRLRKLISKHVPKGPRRDAMLRRMKDRSERMHRGGRQQRRRSGADRPGADRPGADRPGADRPGADRPGADRPGRRATDRQGQRRRGPRGDGNRAPRRSTPRR